MSFVYWQQNQLENNMRLLIIGNPGSYHVGAHFRSAATALGLEVEILDSANAYGKNIWLNRIFKLLFRRRLIFLGRFGREVVAQCRGFSAKLALEYWSCTNLLECLGANWEYGGDNC